MSGFLLDTNLPSELTRIRPDRRVAQWLENANDDELAGLKIWLDETLRPWFAGRIPPVSEEVSERWGILEGQCQLKGRTLSAPDGLIAATALEHNLTVVTRNVKDFSGLGIEIVNPSNGA